MDSTHFLIDNRQYPYQDFNTESNYSSYYRNIKSVVSKFVIKSYQHKWCKKPQILLSNTQRNLMTQNGEISRANAVEHGGIPGFSHISSAFNDNHTQTNVPNSIRHPIQDSKMYEDALVMNYNYNIQALSNAIDAHGPINIMYSNYSPQTALLIPISTWARYLSCGLRKISRIIETIKTHKSLTKAQSRDRHLVVIYSNDLCLFGKVPPLNSQLGSYITDSNYQNNIQQFLTSFDDMNKDRNIELVIVCCWVSLDPGAGIINYNHPHLTYFQQLISNNENITLRCVTNSSMHFAEELRYLLTTATPFKLKRIPFPFNGLSYASMLIKISPSTMISADILHHDFEDLEIVSIVPRSQMDPICLDGKMLLVTSPCKDDHINNDNIDSGENIYPNANIIRDKLLFRSLSYMMATYDILLIIRANVMYHDSICEILWALIPPACPKFINLSNETDNFSSASFCNIHTNSVFDELTMIQLVDKDDMLTSNTDFYDNKRLASNLNLKEDDNTFSNTSQISECIKSNLAYLKSAITENGRLGDPQPYNPFASASKKVDAELENHYKYLADLANASIAMSAHTLVQSNNSDTVPQSNQVISNKNQIGKTKSGLQPPPLSNPSFSRASEISAKNSTQILKPKVVSQNKPPPIMTRPYGMNGFKSTQLTQPQSVAFNPQASHHHAQSDTEIIDLIEDDGENRFSIPNRNINQVVSNKKNTRPTSNNNKIMTKSSFAVDQPTPTAKRGRPSKITKLNNSNKSSIPDDVDKLVDSSEEDEAIMNRNFGVLKNANKFNKNSKSPANNNVLSPEVVSDEAPSSVTTGFHDKRKYTATHH
eukprot:gene12360-16578_t